MGRLLREFNKLRVALFAFFKLLMANLAFLRAADRTRLA
jgi:hypothetical protein